MTKKRLYTHKRFRNKKKHSKHSKHSKRSKKQKYPKKWRRRRTRKKRGGGGEACSVFQPCKKNQVCSRDKQWSTSGFNLNFLPKQLRGWCRDKQGWEGDNDKTETAAVADAGPDSEGCSIL